MHVYTLWLLAELVSSFLAGPLLNSTKWDRAGGLGWGDPEKEGGPATGLQEGKSGMPPTHLVHPRVSSNLQIPLQLGMAGRGGRRVVEACFPIADPRVW